MCETITKQKRTDSIRPYTYFYYTFFFKPKATNSKKPESFMSKWYKFSSVLSLVYTFVL